MGEHHFLLQPDAARLAAGIETLSTFTDPEAAGWTRRPFTPWYAEARAWLGDQMEAAGLATRVDAAANLIGRREGSDTELAPILVGSHTDTVNGGGRFDGVIGVLAGLELAHRLQETGTQLRRPLEIVDFTAEEPSQFGISTVGSRGMTGALSPEMLAATDPAGRTLREALAATGGRPDAIQAEAKTPGDYALYLELHIEQGPVLEQARRVLGVVTGIAGIGRVRVTVTGQPSHAGTTPMSLRQDALTGAAEMVLSLESLCRAREEEGMVGTAGWLEVDPNAANVVPGRVQFIAEVRGVEIAQVDEVWAAFEKQSAAIALARRLEVAVEPISTNPPVQMNSSVVDVLREACEATAPPAVLLPSGAGHDANHMAQICPVGMLFVPSKDGLSHCPEEWSETAHIAAGVEALIRAVLRFDESLIRGS